MQITVQSENLRDALGKILTVVDKRNSRPILTYTLFTVSNDKIYLSATDLEVSAKYSLNAKTDGNASFCINSKNLFDILKELPNTDIHITLEDGENLLKINCNDIHYSLLIYESEEYPKLHFGTENTFEINSDKLLDLINKTSYAISNDETRLHFNGIYLQEVESKLRAVATDGHRLSLIELDLAEQNNEALVNGIIIPKKGVFELKKVAESYPDQTLRISLDESYMYIEAKEEYHIGIRLIAREYPKYQSVIPGKTTFTLTADKEAIFNAVKRIKIMSNEKSNGIKVLIKDNSLTVMANHPSLGDARETIPVDYEGKEMEIGFNAKYLMDSFSILDSEDIILELNNELSPVLVRSNNLQNYLGIIMPLRI
ncbi:DNA polymerase III subunit beta [Bacteriovorax sp. Seq25_V]|uniref:DNA polymerase III subunit beta n=1 Tax=Bacteriovorax sp. Seq25_V TaxID=1201288 RepID=UPI00038A2002|nr:DNA polymerase III subunit beta [Bacteriovorax sp. Seq25_V]EQC43217.1 DNA polymerase III, beta subunit [Bacteriovorax sp. Seq25_V]